MHCDPGIFSCDLLSDVWSLGCVIYELLQLDFPFKAKTLPKLLQVIRTEDPKPLSKTYSNSLRSLVKAMLHKESSKRPSVKQILNNNEINWPLNGIIKSNHRFPTTCEDEVKINRDVCIKYNFTHNIQEQSQSSLDGHFESNVCKSWQDAMRNAERNVNHDTNIIGHQRDRKRAP